MKKIRSILIKICFISFILFNISFAEETIEITDKNGDIKKCTRFENGTIVCM